MKPPAFTAGAALAVRARLAELSDCWLEAKCGQCRGSTVIPIRMLVDRYGPDRHIGTIASRLICKRCRVMPQGVWLNETHNRTPNFGTAPGWSVQLIGEAEPVSA